MCLFVTKEALGEVVTPRDVAADRTASRPFVTTDYLLSLYSVIFETLITFLSLEVKALMIMDVINFYCES